MNIEKLNELKTGMELLEQKKAILKEAKDKFDEENRDLLNEISEINDGIEEVKLILIENAETGFAKDGQKKRLGGIGIRVSKELVYEEAVALNWAKEKDLFLQLDKKSFENVAKTGELDFVKIEDKIKVTFPKQIVLEE